MKNSKRSYKKRKTFKNISQVLSLPTSAEAYTDAMVYARHGIWTLSKEPGIETLSDQELDYLAKLQQAEDVLQKWLIEIVRYAINSLSDHARYILTEITENNRRPTMIAQELNIHTTAIFNSLYGIYSPKYNKMMGGSLKKVKKFLDSNQEYQAHKELKKLISAEPAIEFLDYIIEQEHKNFSLLLASAVKTRYKSIEQ